ncbi:integrase catalytic domain-containing protein [Trichonephila clavipes]|nr:integrase catalytic domain-containing protein [Trichonephila clavipes]
MNLRSSSQLMGDLPPIRFQQICPFETVHLELVSDLSTAAFLAALRRFIARRSSPSKIISDNGSNFKGTSSHLRKLVDLCLQEEVQNFLSLKGIEWSFIPPYTPHFGDPSDFTALTPAHFLVGGPIHQFPEPSQPSRSVDLSERWNLIQRLRQYFWDRWSTEYLHRLQPRSKWWRTKPNLQLGDMVIVEKEKTAPLNWTLGRINKLFFGPDQKVRGVVVVSVNTKYGQLTRNVNKIYLLPNSQEYEL